MTPERPLERRAAGTSLAERATVSGQRVSAAAMTTNGFGFGSRPVYLDRALYTTITVMSVLIAYDGWQHLKFWAAAGVILGPVLAMFVSHVFSASPPGKPSCTSVPAAASR